MTLRLLIATVIVAISISVIAPSVVHAATWSWGYNYLGPSTSNGGPCWNGLGEICSGRNYWVDLDVDKLSGGTVCLVFQSQSAWRCTQISGKVALSVLPSQFGMGGYLSSSVTYITGSTSYLKAQAFS